VHCHYITTPIYYVNGDPHVGHAHTTVMGDIMKRVSLMNGDHVFFTTGTDEHGQKNQAAAERSGLCAAAFLDQQSAKFQRLFNQLEVSCDYFVRTTRPHHVAAVEYVLRKLHKEGLIVKKDYEGMYCEGCEMFKRGVDLDEEGNCIIHQAPVERLSEENYFLQIEPYREWLRSYVEQRPGWLEPPVFRRELLNMLEEPLEDLCLSRPKSRVWLGVELPFDSGYVTYVWFDALINYISSVGYPHDLHTFEQWWSCSVHLMAKDIIKTHCVYWPIMLKALGLQPPTACRVHGYWVGERGVKMSKSLGNVVDPTSMVEQFGPDAFRFYLAKTMRHTDSPIGEKLVRRCYETDLANNLGNLFLRSVKLAKRHFEDRVPRPDGMQDRERQLLEHVAIRARELFPPSGDLSGITALARGVADLGKWLNGYFETAAPWTLGREPAQRQQLGNILYTTLDALRLIMECAYPVIPHTANEMLVGIGSEPVPHGRCKHEFVPRRLVAGTRLPNPETPFPK
jgi:methionyl-tRNA synthetase